MSKQKDKKIIGWAIASVLHKENAINTILSIVLDASGEKAVGDFVLESQNMEENKGKTMGEIIKLPIYQPDLSEEEIEKLREVINDEIGGYEKKHPEICEGMSEAVLARIIALRNDD